MAGMQSISGRLAAVALDGRPRGLPGRRSAQRLARGRSDRPGEHRRSAEPDPHRPHRRTQQRGVRPQGRPCGRHRRRALPGARLPFGREGGGRAPRWPMCGTSSIRRTARQAPHRNEPHPVSYTSLSALDKDDAGPPCQFEHGRDRPISECGQVRAVRSATARIRGGRRASWRSSDGWKNSRKSGTSGGHPRIVTVSYRC